MKTVLLLLLGSSLQFVSGAIVNIALNKPAEMSSKYTYAPNQQSPYVAGAAVDGKTAANGMDIDKIIHTAVGQKSAWWKVDLQRGVQYAEVRIHFRTTYKARRNGVKLYTSINPFFNYPDGQLCHTITGKVDGSDIDDIYHAICAGDWGYLLIYTDTDNDGYGSILDFGEVQVLECSDTTYGPDCSKTCSQRNCVNTTAQCTRDGKCLYGCRPGWMGLDCTQECTSGSYGSNCKLSCSNRKCADASSPCDRLTGQCIGGCQIGYGGLDCNRLNVALRKPANMSSTFTPSGFDFNANTAVDGNTVVGFASDKIIHTDVNQQGAWWTVDLLRPVHDAVVKIYFRIDDKFRRNGLRIFTTLNVSAAFELGNVCDNITGNPNGNDIPNVYTKICPGIWRHLLIFTDVDNDGQGPILDFGEVEVLECEDSAYGKECELSCSDRNCLRTIPLCERDGRCPDDRCKAGWMGLDCSQACPAGLYGPKCSLSCSDRKCVDTSPCDHKTGKCTQGCQTLYHGRDCTDHILTSMHKTLSKLFSSFKNYIKSGASG